MIFHKFVKEVRLKLLSFFVRGCLASNKESIMLRTSVRKFVEIRDDDELKDLLWATLYGFFSMFSYYILRAVRDEISSADRGNLQIIWTVVFLAMLLAVPLYPWAAI